jgi:ATP-dependent helicase/DNAse subunit B
MRFVTGPPGSGKTALILDEFRQALRDGDDAVRLLVPTRTLAQHLQNCIAREGFVFRPDCIQTLSGFVAHFTEDMPEVPEPSLHLVVERAVAHVGRPEFDRVAKMPGFFSAVARTIGEFASAGCDAARLASALPTAPLGGAFLAVYREVETELARRGLALRGKRLQLAAERISRDGLSGIRTVWLDGFHELPDPELNVIEALSRHVEVTLVFHGMTPRLHTMGFHEERLERTRPSPVTAVAIAPGIEREVEEIARRILEQAGAGRPFREMAIIVRAQETYVPILRSTLARFGIPARFYFDEHLAEHGTTRFLTGAVDAVLAGWDYAQTLGVLRLAPRFADSSAMDRFDFKVREQMPDSGLGGLKELSAECNADRLAPLLEALGAIEEWRALALSPRDWSRRLRDLRGLFRPAADRPGADAQVLQSQAAALNAFEEALDETALALGAPHAIALEEFWSAAKAVLRVKPLRIDDQRRNVVHVLSAPEARQWVLPVVFVCGMVEKQFPQFHRQNAFFPDDARRALNEAGIRVRTAADLEREERSLFDAAVTRATLLVTLSYPEFNERGDRNLPSLFLEDILAQHQESIAVRPEPRRIPELRGPQQIDSPELLNFIHERTATVSPSSLESFQQCPFQHFAMRLMRLKQRPVLPRERLDFRTQGEIVHAVLAEWWISGAGLPACPEVFERIFSQVCEEKRIPRGYHTERLRNQMLRDLEAFTAMPHERLQSRTELEFKMPLDGFIVSGKIDRLDENEGAAFVIDYKYSAEQRVKKMRGNDALLQAPLYLLAAEREFGAVAAGMRYIGLKSKVTDIAWKDELPADWRNEAERRALKVVENIRSGRVEPAPADVDNCRFCDCRDACRVALRAELAEAAL